MSVRICIPSKEIRPAASYARSRASAGVAPMPGHVEHPATRGDDLAVARGGAGVGHLGDRGRLLESLDHVALRGGLRVPGGGEDHGHRPVLAELRLDPGQAARLPRREAELEQVGAQPRQHGLRLGVAEADVELEHPRPLRPDHQPGVEDAGKGDPAPPSPRPPAGARWRRSPRPRPARSPAPASSCPCRRCSAPRRRRRSACSPGPARAGRRSRRRRSRAARAPRPRGTPRARPIVSPKRRSVKKTSAASRASASVAQMITPLPAASPSAFSTAG